MKSKKPKIICVTGGKGGTGKTLVAVNLAILFKNNGYKTLLIDGDSENPNTYLLMGSKLKNKTDIPFFKPKISEKICTKCGICAQNCVPHALLHVNDLVPIPILAVCSGCKLCYKICPVDAIEPDYKVIGWYYTSRAYGVDLLIGELKPGEARSAIIIEALVEKLEKIIFKNPDKYDIVILDTAPGAHCDVELLIDMADIVIPVTEPTQFGKLDLLRIIELIELLNKDYKAIVNRSSLLGFKDQFMKQLIDIGVQLLGDIPLDNDIVNSYCQGIPLMDGDSNFDKHGEGYQAFNNTFENIIEWISKMNE
ncbi:MAG: AAA family ATPase [Candidatus Hodarchaeota archaeon]